MDIKSLNEKLGELRGLDFELAESQERAAGNNAIEITTTKSFQARLASMALGVPVADIKELPIKKYNQVCTQVLNFLYVPSDDETPAWSSDLFFARPGQTCQRQNQ